MKHYELADWQLYTSGKVSRSYEAEMEDHLYSCSQCLNLYMQAIELAEGNLPIVEDSRFTEKVMNQLGNEQGFYKSKNGNSKANQYSYKKQLVHYILAAVATLVLTFSGVFQSITGLAGTTGSIKPQTNKPSYTEEFIAKTFAWKDSLEKNKEEDK
ncbi:hypothetical protein A8F94_17785 [Bacillus sp. FJAT-27225]|uniref:hypothetical protein n=1 Tax=Bacillus sp. FJAT-27225 TaxID=1743144 RepID=UPI00080C2E8B|nr:hypothetical protein [Bacillus sp. FJAT-27225]OCA82998.1 hypothetical protein A8F94_17785 [Bacillus sp. FJAT-27225]